MPSKNSAPHALRLICFFAALSLLVQAGHSQNQTIRVIAFGAHPDDCDLGAGGFAAKYGVRGDKVKFVSITNGDAVGNSSKCQKIRTSGERKLQPEWREALEKRYGAQAAGVQHAEAFEITEYGRQPNEKRFANSLRFFPNGDSLLARLTFPDFAEQGLMTPMAEKK
jgi:GlcNAc-PI de-N-acetylase